MAIDHLDEKIVEEAEKLIRRDGLHSAQMRELASNLGISRSTLYRHYNNMVEIAMPIVRRYTVELESIGFRSDLRKSGYENLCDYMRLYFDKLCDNAEKVYFLAEFDVMYNLHSPHMIGRSEQTAMHREWAKAHRSPIVALYEDGVRDGSIRDDGQDAYTGEVLAQACLATAERIITREEAYVTETGHGRELAWDAVALMLEAIRAE